MRTIEKIAQGALGHLLCLCLLTACSSGLSGDDDVGTVLTRPKPPSLSFFPDFENFVPETSLQSNSASELVTSENISMKAVVTNLNVLTIWNDVVFDGIFAESRSQKEVLQQFGDLVAQALADGEITEAPEEEVQIEVSGDTRLVDTTASSWTVGLKAEGDFVRFYFTNGDTGLIQATYLVESDEEGNALRGLFAYVNPDQLSADAADEKRLFALAFDFSAASQAVMTLRSEEYSGVDANYHAVQIHQQCDDAGLCLGEFLQIQSTAPTRELDDAGFRFSWDEGTQAVCLVGVEYVDGALSTFDTFSFDGPTGPTSETTELNECTVDTPFWGDHIFTIDDLIERYEDTDPVGGTALDYYGDGASQEGWDTLTEELIEGWLSATEF